MPSDGGVSEPYSGRSAVSVVGVRNTPKLKDLLEEWNFTCARFSKDPIAIIIQSFKKNNFKYPPCSGSATEAQPGAIETLAHQLLSGLYEIMCKHKAQIEHEGRDDNDDEDSDFDMDNAPIPVISGKPHAVSKEYKKKVAKILSGGSASADLWKSLIMTMSESPKGIESQASELDPQQGSNSLWPQAQPHSPVSYSDQHDSASTPPSQEPSKHAASSSLAMYLPGYYCKGSLPNQEAESA
ncbi:hypothetical protein EDB83DRAFT_2323986 [Lactarius deliciosus]|nr:hypothetical protein EDB83DRAFT_2323986 [Lactarius deliciosus]